MGESASSHSKQKEPYNSGSRQDEGAGVIGEGRGAASQTSCRGHHQAFAFQGSGAWFCLYVLVFTALEVKGTAEYVVSSHRQSPLPIPHVAAKSVLT